MTKPDLAALSTEARNPRTHELDALPTADLLAIMHDEDRAAVAAVGTVLPRIATAVDQIAERLRKGGRLLYVGAGTSGRLGVLDAAECGPTFSAGPEQVRAVIAGGPSALLAAVEGAEDDPERGAQDLAALHPGPHDAVVGIAASGRTPYVLGALRAAASAGALRIAIVCNAGSPVAAAADLPIEVPTGPEVLTGSTRLKAGTATKLVLNMLSTGAFVRRHKVYGNLMVDVQASNQKLRARCERMLVAALGCDLATAQRLLAECDGEVKTAIVVGQRGIAPAAARTLLFHCEGSVRAVLERES
jgi:N-acetylmuramic acid 6-phosphate etherase